MRYHTGFYTVSGACYIYTDCSCTYYNSAMIGYLTDVIVPYGHQPIAGYDAWFDATNYLTPQYSQCTSGSCAKTGVIASFPTKVVDSLGYDSFPCT